MEEQTRISHGPPGKPAGQGDYYLTLGEAASYLRVSASTVRNWLRSPAEKMPHLKAGRKYLFRKDELDAWLRERAAL